MSHRQLVTRQLMACSRSSGYINDCCTITVLAQPTCSAASWPGKLVLLLRWSHLFICTSREKLHLQQQTASGYAVALRAVKGQPAKAWTNSIERHSTPAIAADSGDVPEATFLSSDKTTEKHQPDISWP